MYIRPAAYPTPHVVKAGDWENVGDKNSLEAYSIGIPLDLLEVILKKFLFVGQIIGPPYCISPA